ncbi:2-dehydropantoate 2-reductase [Limosilactobacillus reuteri]|nr:2-dehydropantoate 2-reductase [Limosilactobacillus reuteri]
MKVAVAGVGAMGTRFALKLKQAGNDVTVVDGWDERVAALKQGGLRANLDGEEVAVDVPVYGQKEVPHDLHFDVVLFFTKSMQLEQMVKDMLPVFDDDTLALCLMNGIGHEKILEKYLPKNRVFLGNTMWTAQMTRPDHVLLEDDGSCELRNVEPGEPQDRRAAELVKALDEAGLKARLLDDPRYSVFRKGCVNGTLNTLCTLLNATLRNLVRQVMPMRWLLAW